MKELDFEKFLKNKKSIGTRNPEDDTYVLRNMRIALENKQFWNYIEALGIPHDNAVKQYVYNYYVGRVQLLQHYYVFMCRENIQPSKWYIRYGEKLPDRIEFKPKHKLQYLYNNDSLGHKKLKKLTEQYTIEGVANLYDLKVMSIKNVLYRTIDKITGKEHFKTFPQQSIIIKMKDEINPDSWFIFPDET